MRPAFAPRRPSLAEHRSLDGLLGALLGALLAVGATAALAAPAAARAQAGMAPSPAPRTTPDAGALAVTAENATAAAEVRRGAPRTDARARPGDVLHYRLAFTNPTARAVRGVRLEDAIPAGTHFVAGSARAARADVVAEYSADGGRSFAARPVERVVVAGAEAERPVPAERYTHVRWTVVGPVAPRDRVTAEFDARIPAAER